MIRYLLTGLMILIFISGCSYRSANVLPPPPPPLEACLQNFIDKMATDHHFDRQQLNQLLQQVKFQAEVINRLDKPFEKKPWDFYKHFFVREDRIQRGVIYWKKHATVLQEAAEKFGVPPQIIVAIIGMEADYGGNLGHFPELSTLATIACHYPQRTDFFQKELEHYLLLV